MPHKATRQTGAKVRDAEQLNTEIQAMAPGTKERLEVRVSRLPSGSWANMPVTIVRGIAGGPRIWLSGGVHGNEVMGVEIVRRLAEELDPMRLRGTVVAVPIVNVFGFTTASRYLPDGRDLNRSFPGSARGSLAGRTAHLFYQNIVRPAVLGIDYHTAAGGRNNLAQLRCNLDNPEVRRLARAFHTPIAIHSSLRDGSLRAAAQKDGIPVMLFEAGEASRFDPEAIRLAMDGTLRVMKAYKMLKEAPPRGRGEQMISRSSMWTRAGRSGFCHLMVSVGQRVRQGATVAIITDSTANAEMQVKARTTGVVVGVQKNALIHRGDALVHIAELEA